MTANAEITAAEDPPFISSATSQEEGVFVGVSSFEKSQENGKNNDMHIPNNNDESVEGQHEHKKRKSDAKLRRGNSKACNNGGDEIDTLEDYLFSEDSDENTTKKKMEKSVEMTTTAHHHPTPVTAFNSHEDKDTTPLPGYYTTAPSVKPNGLSILQTLREYRHNRCIMTPLSTLVLLAILLSSLISLLFTIPQFIIGLLLGPLVKRQFWLVEFLYRWDIVGWGHVKLMQMAGKRNNGGGKKKKDSSDGSTVASNLPKDPKKKLKQLGLLGHSDTIFQRITVVPGRVYVHPIPQFVDNVCYLIVCLPEKTDSGSKDKKGVNGLPIIGILIDVGEADRTLAYLECIYEKFYEQEYPRSDYYRNSGEEEGNVNTGGMGIEIHAILSTHRHHDHTAGVGDMVNCLEQARCRLSKCVSVSGGSGDADIYNVSPGKVVVVGGAVESVPHCNLFVKNKCFIPLPSVTIAANETTYKNDMNSAVCIECIVVPSHTRGSVVYALRSYPIGSSVPVLDDVSAHSHLFTGDAIFSGGGGVPFEADLEYASDNFIKNPSKLKNKNGSTNFRAGAGSLSIERCFAEVLTRATERIAEEEQNIKLLKELQSKVLLYPGHEYTTDLMMRQFDPKTTTSEGHWTRMAPSVFFENASHYFVSAHRRALPQGQKLLSLPTPLNKEVIINPNFRSLKRRGEHVINALRIWHEFGAKNRIPRFEVEASQHETIDKREKNSPFQTVYSNDLDTIVRDLRAGTLSAASAADKIELLQRRIDEKLIGRRPIPNHLPSHRNVYVGIVALAILGSPPSGVTVSDAMVMDVAAPVDSSDFILISKSRLISTLSCLGLISSVEPVRIQDIISLLWEEARLEDDTLTMTANNTDDTDHIELGLLKLALFGVAFNQPSSKYCLPCHNPKAAYTETSWATKSEMKRTSGELVRHVAEECLLCQNVLEQCSHSVYV